VKRPDLVVNQNFRA